MQRPDTAIQQLRDARPSLPPTLAQGVAQLLAYLEHIEREHAADLADWHTADTAHRRALARLQRERTLLTQLYRGTHHALGEEVLSAVLMESQLEGDAV